MVEKPRIYLICPVRGVTQEEKEFLEGHVRKLEAMGFQVHYPPRDVNQEDSVGLRILTEHREAMRTSNAVQIYWNGKSQGSFFDLGMGFMGYKPLVLANPQVLKTLSLDDFDKCVLEEPLSEQDIIIPSSPLNVEKYEKREKIKACKAIEYQFTSISREALFELGMMFMAGKPLRLLNRGEVERQRTPHKSFQNVLLALDDLAQAS
ncbi:hypothetical protein FJZ17_02160 [Candidatus Pacearchaeota archaeon]|nr:hypothetical protein [Candidatus Pacearchaeota archaeon]